MTGGCWLAKALVYMADARVEQVEQLVAERDERGRTRMGPAAC